MRRVGRLPGSSREGVSLRSGSPIQTSVASELRLSDSGRTAVLVQTILRVFTWIADDPRSVDYIVEGIVGVAVDP